jgi:hypothetical protein
MVAAKLTREEYLPLIASAEARVWMARPEGFERAVPTIVIDGVADLIRVLRAA